MRIESILSGGKLLRPSVERDGDGHYLWVVSVSSPNPSKPGSDTVVYKGSCDAAPADEALDIAADMASQIAKQLADVDDE
ncbi:MAG: hypothetical protein RXR20_36255 [Paraburkholderia sp.]|jgi:hypothetical protein|uniref:hypothetical protein n=1 Tax=Paraburkholderia sp. USG1 TaxID=2952268 RepID=UPI002859E832|nr:hypothetical protein [Paraburkholderia sp. USG1]MDR8394801.1 hypothetical protein [Paraburkholderia sp. USG1]